MWGPKQKNTLFDCQLLGQNLFGGPSTREQQILLPSIHQTNLKGSNTWETNNCILYISLFSHPDKRKRKFSLRSLGLKKRRPGGCPLSAIIGLESCTKKTISLTLGPKELEGPKKGNVKICTPVSYMGPKKETQITKKTHRLQHWAQKMGNHMDTQLTGHKFLGGPNKIKRKKSFPILGAKRRKTQVNKTWLPAMGHFFEAQVKGNTRSHFQFWDKAHLVSQMKTIYKGNAGKNRPQQIKPLMGLVLSSWNSKFTILVLQNFWNFRLRILI